MYRCTKGLGNAREGCVRLDMFVGNPRSATQTGDSGGQDDRGVSVKSRSFAALRMTQFLSLNIQGMTTGTDNASQSVILSGSGFSGGAKDLLLLCPVLRWLSLRPFPVAQFFPNVYTRCCVSTTVFLLP